MSFTDGEAVAGFFILLIIVLLCSWSFEDKLREVALDVLEEEDRWKSSWLCLEDRWKSKWFGLNVWEDDSDYDFYRDYKYCSPYQYRLSSLRAQVFTGVSFLLIVSCLLSSGYVLALAFKHAYGFMYRHLYIGTNRAVFYILFTGWSLGIVSLETSLDHIRRSAGDLAV